MKASNTNSPTHAFHPPRSKLPFFAWLDSPDHSQLTWTHLPDKVSRRTVSRPLCYNQTNLGSNPRFYTYCTSVSLTTYPAWPRGQAHSSVSSPSSPSIMCTIPGGPYHHSTHGSKENEVYRASSVQSRCIKSTLSSFHCDFLPVTPPPRF